ncbi:MAG: hypothetical protein ACYS0H_26200, partial [Planctomycetota bacterium]
ILGIFTRQANSAGAIIGVICSTVILYCVQRFTDVHFFLYAATGITACASIGYLASLLLPSPRPPAANLTLRAVTGNGR